MAIGSPLGPSLANFFLVYLEETRFLIIILNQSCMRDMSMIFLLFLKIKMKLQDSIGMGEGWAFILPVLCR